MGMTKVFCVFPFSVHFECGSADIPCVVVVVQPSTRHPQRGMDCWQVAMTSLIRKGGQWHDVFYETIRLFFPEVACSAGEKVSIVEKYTIQAGRMVGLDLRKLILLPGLADWEFIRKLLRNQIYVAMSTTAVTTRSIIELYNMNNKDHPEKQVQLLNDVGHVWLITNFLRKPTPNKYQIKNSWENPGSFELNQGEFELAFSASDIFYILIPNRGKGIDLPLYREIATNSRLLPIDPPKS